MDGVAGASLLWSTVWAGGSMLGAFSFLLRFLPNEYASIFYAWIRKLTQYFNSYILFEIPEFYGAGGNEIYNFVEAYLSSNTAIAAEHVSLCRPKNASHNTFSLGHLETLEDSSFMGTKVWWTHEISERNQPGIQWSATPNDEKRKYYLKIRKADKDRLLEPYVQHLIDTAKLVKDRTRDRLLYTNVKTHSFMYKAKAWESVPFKHPSTFETLAMDPDLKDEIKEDLIEFTKGKEFYEKAGKPWKRGYLLYGPPGTGKSSMIAAIANFLKYDIYDVELTEVKSNSELRTLLIQTSNKSVIVIEDIDCSVELAERAKAQKEAKSTDPVRNSDDETMLAKHKGWAADLISRGYGDPLPAPSPSVQATLAAIRATDIHEFVQTQDRMALADQDEEGMTAPLFLVVLDLSQWTHILSVSLIDSQKAMEKLRRAHEELADMLDAEAEQIEVAQLQLKAVDIAVKRANPQDAAKGVTSISDSQSSVAIHPMMQGLDIAPAHKAAIEDLAASIQSSQDGKDLALLIASGKGPMIPLMPARAIEFQLAHKFHKCWSLSNINLMAPITISMWKAWLNLSDDQIEELKANAIHNTGLLKEGQDIPGAFSLSSFDHHKCGTLDIKVHTRQDLQTGYGRGPKYSSAMWNCQRPYLRCLCRAEKSTGCKGDIMWLDHAVWYMLNHLEEFFNEDFPTLASKFAAFIVWVSGAAKIAVLHQISFAYARELMVEAAIKLAEDPTAKLLPNHPDAPGIRKIERLLKPASFSVANPTTPSPNGPARRGRHINCNVLADSTPPHPRAMEHGAPRMTAQGGRGGYNRKFRPAQNRQPQQASPYARPSHSGTASRPRQTRSNQNEAFVFIGPNRRSPAPAYSEVAQDGPEPALSNEGPSPSYNNPHQQSPSSSRGLTSGSQVVPRFDRTKMRGKILDWD